MKKFFTEWWDIQREERAMEKAYMKKHGKGVVLLNAISYSGSYRCNGHLWKS